MKQARIPFPITAFVVLPFRAMVDPFRAKIVWPGDTEPTSFELGYSDTTPLLPSTYVLNASAWTQVSVHTHFLHPSDFPEPDGKWFMSGVHGVEILDDVVLPRLNEFLLRIRRVTNNRFGTDVIRSVGALDLVIASLQFRGEGVFTRGSATMLEMVRGRTGWDGTVDTTTLGLPVPQEWATLIRATDLVNHGYFLEGFVTAFALLDALIQDFVQGLLAAKGFRDDMSEELMRTIERDRLRRYLELLLPLLGVSSPLNEKRLKDELKWLNGTRNKVMHGGRRCGAQEAQRGLEAVLSLLRALNSCGAPYVLPDSLPFWSSRR